MQHRVKEILAKIQYVEHIRDIEHIKYSDHQNEVEHLHCVPITTVSFQKHAARCLLKNQPISKIFHWAITNALTFISKVWNVVNLKHFSCFTAFDLYHKFS